MNVVEAINLAVQHQQAERPAEAERIYRQILATEANQPEALNNLGVICRDRGEIGKAMEYFERAAAAAPEFVSAMNNLGSALWQEGRGEEAVSWFKKALALNPSSAEGYFNLGACLTGLGRAEESISVYRQAAALWPAFAEAHNNLGLVWYERMNFGEAIDCFGRAVAARPEYVDGLNNLGLALKYASRWDEATAAFMRVLALRPHDPTVYWNLKDVERRKPRMAAAAVDDLPRLPCLSGKVALLRCDRATRERLRGAGLHGGFVIDERDGSEPWLAAQFAATSDPLKLRQQVGMWLEWTRNEAAMAGATCTIWLPNMTVSAAEICRAAVGADLIEVSGETAEEIHASLRAMAVEPQPTASKVFAVVSIRNGGTELLPHWLEHYSQLGVDEMLVGVFDDVPGESRRAIEECAERWRFRLFEQNWQRTTEEEQYGRRQTACREAGARRGTWIMHTDLDELHQYPAPIREIIAAAEGKKMEAIYGRFVDRVAEDGSLPQVRGERSLWEQFPVECRLTERILGGGTRKVMLATYNVGVTAGHHEAHDRPMGLAPLGESGDYRVAHFKWHGGVLSRMRWGLQQEKPSPAWKREVRRFMAWLASKGGRIDVSDPVLEAKSAAFP